VPAASACLLLLAEPARAADWRKFVSTPPEPRPVVVVPAETPVVVPEVVPEEPAVEPPTGDRVGSGNIVSLATAMRQHIERALRATRGQIEGRRGAAALLEINPHTLRARMRKLGVDPAKFRD